MAVVTKSLQPPGGHWALILSRRWWWGGVALFGNVMGAREAGDAGPHKPLPPPPPAPLAPQTVASVDRQGRGTSLSRRSATEGDPRNPLSFSCISVEST